MDSIPCPKPEFEQVAKHDYDHAIQCLADAMKLVNDLERRFNYATGDDIDSPAMQLLNQIGDLRDLVYAARGSLSFHKATRVEVVYDNH